MSKKEKVTRITLELIIGRKTNIQLEGSCYEETPDMETQVFWYHCNGSVPEGSINEKKLLGQVTLFRKYQQLIAFTDEYYRGKPYEIKMSVKREK